MFYKILSGLRRDFFVEAHEDGRHSGLGSTIVVTFTLFKVADKGGDRDEWDGGGLREFITESFTETLVEVD